MRKSDVELEALFDRIRALSPEWRDRITETIAGFVEQVPEAPRPRIGRRRTDGGAQIVDLRDARMRRDEDGS